jgi:hypothetical protein
VSQALVQVDGAKELRRSLKRAGDDLGDLKDANAEVAGMVAGRASSLAPRVSGRLAGSVRGNRAAASAVVKVGGASLPYAGPVHWGWPARHIAANPFAVNAAHDTEPAWTATYLDAIEAIIGKVRGA